MKRLVVNMHIQRYIVMNRKLNNKGYMLIEIILAFVIAMGIAYFMFELITVKQNKNFKFL